MDSKFNSHFSTASKTPIFSIGFSNGYNDHLDDKWEIVAGGRNGTEIIMRAGNYEKNLPTLARNDTTNLYQQIRNNFVLEVNDGQIALYAADSNGVKGNVIVEWNDDTIVKSFLNTLTVTGGFGGSGVVRVKGICSCQHLDHTRTYADDYNHQVVDNGNAHGKDYFHIIAPAFTHDLQ